MYIQTLKIKDFKAIKEIEFNFGKINLISGETGEGKTSVIEALTFLLTNSLNDKIEEYVRWGEKRFSLHEVFKHKGKVYNYTIGSGKTTDRELVIEDTFFNRSDAVKRLSEVIDPNLTLYSNISMQHKSTELLFEKPAVRLQKIKLIFKVDKINEKVDLIKADIKNLQDQISSFQVEINTLRGITFELFEVPSLPEINIEDLENKLKNLEIEKEKHQIELKAHEVYKEQLKVYETAILDLEKNTVSLKNNESILGSLIRIIEEPPIFNEKRYDECQTIMKNNTMDIIKLENSYNSYLKIKEEEKSLLIKISERETLIKQHRLKRLPRISLSKEEIISKKELLQETYIKLAKQSDKISAIMEGKCPTCGSEFSIVEVEFEKDLKNVLVKQKILLEDELAEVEKQIKEYNLVESENKISKSRIDIWTNDIIDANERIKLLRITPEPDISKKDELQKEYDLIYKESEELGKVKQLIKNIVERNKEKQDKLKTLEREKTILLTKIEELSKIIKPKEFIFTSNYDEALYKDISFTITEYTVKKSEYLKIEEMNRIIENKQKENIRKISDLDRKTFSVREEIGILKETSSLLDKQFSSYLVDKGSTFIKNKMNQFFQKGYGKYQIDLQQDGKGIEFLYSENGGEWHSISMLSGFEQQLFGTSFRVALTKMQDLNFMLLDEVDSDASTQASLKLYNAILNENFEQLFVVTHNQETQSFFSTNESCKVFEIKNGLIEK